MQSKDVRTMFRCTCWHWNVVGFKLCQKARWHLYIHAEQMHICRRTARAFTFCCQSFVSEIRTWDSFHRHGPSRLKTYQGHIARPYRTIAAEWGAPATCPQAHVCCQKMFLEWSEVQYRSDSCRALFVSSDRVAPTWLHGSSQAFLGPADLY